MSNNIIKNQEGFTLVEMLVATIVFVLMVLAVMGVYLAFNSGQIRTSASQQLLNDSQYAMDLMAEEIRNNEIISFPVQVFGLVDGINCSWLLAPIADGGVGGCILLEREDGQTIAYIQQTGLVDGIPRLYRLLLTCADDYTSCDPIDEVNDPGAYIKILSPEVNSISVQDLDFDLNPQLNPYIAGGANEQPRVTINMRTLYSSTNPTEQVDHIFQTTVSSRVYKR